MNYKILVHITGKIIMFEGLLMMLSVLVGLIYREKATVSVLIVALAAIALGFLLQLKKPMKKSIRAKEGFVITGLSWLVMSIVGAVPFILSGAIPDFTDAVFETASGFTTTGASIITDLSVIPRCILFWRSFTHWIGGMGILTFVLIFIPSNADEMNIMRAEAPGPSVEKMVPKVRETALTLYAIYTAMTVALMIALAIAGMPIFDSICISFGTAGTGGFGIKGDSIASYSTLCQNIITVGMLLFGVNFSVYYLAIMKKFKDILHSEEVLWYFIIYITASLIVALGSFTKFISFAGLTGGSGYDSFGDALQSAFFQVSSIMTTTGFATCDFNKWPDLPKAVMVSVMFIGACAGSTGGGMKVSRLILYVKQIFREFQNYIHPNSVSSVKLDGKVVNNNTIRTTNVYLMAYMMVFLLSFIIVLFDGFDMVTTFTGVAATMNNIGPGLSVVGPAGSFAGFNHLSKWVFIFDMIAGRLELIPVLIMFAPRTWRKK